ncbi:MAG: sigma-70 family RNA polymerase sigma factor [Pseudonocardiaceae bacterium]|nr:sigma-70 family RNA polymerase sigma factor [Pseudonocardiaceae bacterium]
MTVDPAAEVVRASLVADLDNGFAKLVRAYQGVVYSVALRITGRPAEAEDLAAESLLRAYRALRGYDTARIEALVPRAWLLAIVVNTGRNAVRDANRRPAPASAEAQEYDRPAVGASVEDRVEADELGRELGAQLARLPHAQRAAVVLRHVADLPIAEVAEVLGCPEGTAKSHVFRGLHRLRALLDPRNDRATLTAPRSSR